MKKNTIALISLITIASFLSAETEQLSVGTATNQQSVLFQYDNEDLVNVINYIASRKEINLLLPTKADEKLTGKLTWHLEKKVSLDEAWQLLQTILGVAGYAIIPRPTYYEVVKISPSISREAVPLYINTPFERLPLSNERIRYIYYLANIKQEGEAEGEISTVLKAMLPADTVFKIDSATNALLIMAPANDIRSAMTIITQLDQPGFQERMDIIRLNHTNAQMVADLFNNKVLQSADAQKYRLDTKRSSESTYFSKFVKIIAHPKTNSLIVLGRSQAIERIREFIQHYIDVEQESGKSILHVYQLQYLDAPSFAKVLNDIVQSKQMGGVEQSTGDKKAATGPQRYFDEVIIAVDTPTDTAADQFTVTPASTGGETKESVIQAPKYYGGNKLIIAARNDDWKKIKELIEKLDQPSPQVLIEVLIADLTLDDSRALGTLFRNPAKIPMPGSTNFQSAQLDPGVIPNSFDNPQTIGVLPGVATADLLRQFHIDPSTGQRSDTGDPLTNVASLVAAGSTVISFNDNDGKTWGITQILKLLDHTKILSHPHVISTNNQVATIEISEIRLLPDQASGSQGGTIVQTNKDIPASLKVNIIPRISISDIRSSTVSLNVTIDINEYQSATNNTRNTRKVKTNAIVNTGDILALGGLLRTNDSDSLGETPVLSKIPVVGWLFKRRISNIARTNLTVFISPTIIMPRSREGLSEYTKDYLNITRSYVGKDDLFGSLKDPITRWFFQDEEPTEQFTRQFIKDDETQKQRIPMPLAPMRTSEIAPSSKEQESIFAVDQQEDQLTQLKNLLKDIDNPFQHIGQPTFAQNNEKPSKDRKRKR